MSTYSHGVTNAVTPAWPQGKRAYLRAVKDFNNCPSCPEAAARLQATMPRVSPSAFNTTYYSATRVPGPPLLPRIVQNPNYFYNHTMVPAFQNMVHTIQPVYQQYVHPYYQYAANNFIRPCVNVARQRIPWL